MLNQPTSSPMMKTMFGFFSSAAAELKTPWIVTNETTTAKIILIGTFIATPPGMCVSGWDMYPTALCSRS